MKFVALLLVASFVILVGAPSSLAQSGPAIPQGVKPTEIHPRAPADIAVGIDATITAILHDQTTEVGLADQNLTFSLRSAFGLLVLKSTLTDAQGRAILDYDPVSEGSFTILISFAGSPTYAPSNASITLVVLSNPPGGAWLPPDRAIVFLVITVLGGVWATYGFVLWQVAAIRGEPVAGVARRRRSEVKGTMEDEELEGAETPKRAQGSENAPSRLPLALAIAALVVAAGSLGTVAVGVLSPKPAGYTPQDVNLQVAIVPDLKGEGWDAWVPNELVVHLGDRLILTIYNPDEMEHGLKIDAFSIDKPIAAGTMNETGAITPSETVVTFVADHVGNFEIRCNVPCGDGHEYMVGTLVVLPD